MNALQEERPFQQQGGSSLRQADPQPPYIKEEEEDLWVTQEGECVVGQEEDDVMTVVSVKTEEHEDKAPESSQLHHSPNIHQLIGHQEECLPHLQGDSFTLEDPQPSHFKGDKEDPQPLYFEEEEGECPVGQEEDDVMTVVSVKTEEHEDKALASQQQFLSSSLLKHPRTDFKYLNEDKTTTRRQSRARAKSPAQHICIVNNHVL
ncbi:uncharacterized protein LOC133636352 isoform X2 [Entelurus aequoreus]|uniref:uncharacterized protein LOC133636352 isoform X2 n=1 Tax=Entelurus aequoreus TaxID=161455 RepID=UPI002B1D6C1A|nr:uncharacterized protein LOC133636352 isoform X2 [Entelurus aequoreus]